MNHARPLLADCGRKAEPGATSHRTVRSYL